MRPFRSHGDGRFTREQLAACGPHVVFEEGVRIWHPEMVSIGDNVYVGHDAMLKGYYRNTLAIGDDTWLGQGVFLHAAGGIRIGRAVGIGPFVRMLTSTHGEAGRDVPILASPLEFAPIVVEDDADIGVGTIILPGVTIGRGAQIGAGAVVTRDVPPYAVAAGNPARVLRYRGERVAPRVLVVGGGPFQLSMIRTAVAQGFETVVVDRATDAPGMALATHSVAVDTTNVAGVVEVAHRFRVDAVVTAASDVALTAVSAVSAARELAGHPPEAVLTCRDKLATYRAVKAAGLAVPVTLPVSRASEVGASIDLVGGYPFVIKPRSAAGGRGVSIVREPDGLEPALERALPHAMPGQGVLLQAHVGGRSVGVEAVFRHGRIARAFVLDDQYQDAVVSPIGHSLPSTLSTAEQARVVADVEHFGRALGLTDGPANFDLRIENDRTVLIECNARLGGSAITDLVRTHCGVDLSAVALQIALGRAPDALFADARRATPVAGRLVGLRGRGRLAVDAERLEALRARPGVERVDLTAPPGEAVTMVVERWSIVGVVLTTAETSEAAVARAAEVAAEVAAAARLEP